MQASKMEKAKIETTGFLRWIEVIGNKIPDTFTIFLWFILGLLVLSSVMSAAHVSVVNPTTHKAVTVKNLLTIEALQWFLPNVLKNFANFPPLPVVLVVTMGIGVAQKTNLLQGIIRSFVYILPKWSVTVALAFIAFFSHIAGEVSFLIMPPISAMLFYSVGRHPLAGLATGMAGLACGYSANLLIVALDAVLAGLSTSAAAIIDNSVVVSPVDNWYFFVLSVFVFIVVTTIITEKYVEPRLGEYKGSVDLAMEDVTDAEKKALRYTGLVAMLFIGVLLLTIVPENGILRDAKTHGIIGSPFLKGIAPLIFLFFALTGVTYGAFTGTIKNTKDFYKIMSNSIKDISNLLVLMFLIAEFTAAFAWSNLGEVIATGGADFLMSIGLSGVIAPLIVFLMTGILTCFIPSGGGLWGMMSPLFVPMFMLLGFHPAYTQLAMRIGMPMFMAICPTNPFLSAILKAGQDYVPELSYGRYLSLMMPYVIAFNVIWPLMYVAFHFFGLPIGPGVTSTLK